MLDLDRIHGSVDIAPRGRLTLDVNVRFLAAGGSRALFSLNPGLQVDAVENAAGAALAFNHGNGLLDVDLGRSPAAGEAIDLRLRAHGRPDLRFGYLDSAIDFYRIKFQDAQIVLLGAPERLCGAPLRRRCPPRWPGCRAPARRSASPIRGRRPRDFFELDLEVGAPTRAGPSPDRAKPSRPASRQRFAPAAVVPEAALVAGRFDRRTTEIEGVEVELLLHPRHLRNVELFADAREEIEAVAAERFASARELGLPYPYRQLTLVEVPWTLRSYGGGWRMDTERAPPGMLLISESSLPTARFEFAVPQPGAVRGAGGRSGAGKGLRAAALLPQRLLGRQRGGRRCPQPVPVPDGRPRSGGAGPRRTVQQLGEPAGRAAANRTSRPTCSTASSAGRSPA